MADYVKVLKYESGITVCFYIEDDEIFAIGEKMNELCDEATTGRLFFPII